MANNAGYDNMDQGNQANNDAPPNAMSLFVISEEFAYYQLPQGNVEEPFDPITSFAVAESGRIGPLNEDHLKALLQKLDRRFKGHQRTVNVALRYTHNIMGLITQLLRLRHRISRIEINEEYKTDCLKGRIQELVKAIDKRKQISRILEISLTNSARKAFEEVGRDAPVNTDRLLNILFNGNYNMETREQELQLMTQMDEIISSMKYYEDIRKLHFEKVCGFIRRATKNLIRESLNY